MTWRPGEGGLRTDRLGQGVRHRAVVERSDQPTLPVHLEVARRPHGRRAYVSGEDGILRRELVDEAREILRVDGAILARGARELVEPLSCVHVVRPGRLQECALSLSLDARQQCLHRLADIADETELQARALSEGAGIMVDLCDLRLRRIEVPVGKIGAEHQQRVAVHHRVVAGRKADEARHSDVERVVPLDVLLAAQRVDDGRPERVGKRHDLVVGARASRAT